jgi:hypothetical protein
MSVEQMLSELGDSTEAELMARDEVRPRPSQRSRLVLVVTSLVFALGIATALAVRSGGSDEPNTTTETPSTYEWREISESTDWGVLPSVVALEGRIFSFSSGAFVELDPGTGAVTPLAAAPRAVLAPGAVATPDGIVVAGTPDNEATGFAAALYDPTTEIWTDLGTAPLQPGETVEPGTQGASDGTTITWWGIGTSDTLGPPLRLKLRAQAWSRGAAPTLSSRGAAASAANSEQLLVWGGCNTRADVQCDDPPATSRSVDDGAILDLRSGEWRSLPASPLEPGTHPRAAWVSDTEVLVTGGAQTASGALFDISTWTWTSVATPPIELLRYQTLTGIQGGAVLVGGLDQTGFASRTAAAWDNATRSWTVLPQLPIGRERHGTIAIGDEILTLGGSTPTPALAL